jgi:hypothetical protein
MRKRILVALAVSILVGIGPADAQWKRPHNPQAKSGHTQWRRPPSSPQEKLDDIIERLARLEAAMDAPSTSATFCISQGRGIELKGKWAAEAKAEVDLGAGWPNVAWAKAIGKVNLPVVLFAGPIPIPIPTEAALELGGGHGRNFDICVDIPIALSAGDQARLLSVADTMNDPGNLGENLLDKGKFQRRAARAINYACRKVGGLLQCPILANLPLTASAQSTTDAADQEFDRADGASENLLDGGFGSVQEGLQTFQDGNVGELLASLDLPSNVRSVLEDPERIVDGMPNLSGGVPSCESLQITAAMRSRLPALNSLCSELDGLPNANLVKGAFTTIDQLSDEVLDALAEIVGPLLNNVGEAPQSTKSRFCNSPIGQRRVFNRFCGRS